MDTTDFKRDDLPPLEPKEATRRRAAFARNCHCGGVGGKIVVGGSLDLIAVYDKRPAAVDQKPLIGGERTDGARDT